MNTFNFNGTSCSSYGVYCDGANAFNTSSRAYDSISIAGKSGDLLISQNRYINVNISYPCFISTNFVSNFNGFMAYLNSVNGYARLTDTYNPTYYRMARFTGGVQSDMSFYNKVGSFEVEFDCKPQKYLLTGESSVTVSSGDTITNPTLYSSQPIIRVYGDGTLNITNSDNAYQIVIGASSYTYIDIDCEIMDCTSAGNNCNEYITLTNGFPTLAPNTNTITYSGNITQVDITSRWYEI